MRSKKEKNVTIFRGSLWQAMSVVTYREDLLPTRRLQFSEVRKKTSLKMTQWDQNTFKLFLFDNCKHFFQFHDTLKDWIFVCNENGYSLRSHYYSENLFQSHGKPALITVVDPIFIAWNLFSKKGDPCTARALWDALFVKLTESNNQFQAVNSEFFWRKDYLQIRKQDLV